MSPYKENEGFWKNLIKGVIIIIFTIAALGICYSIFTVVSLALCILVSLVLSNIIGTVNADGMSAIESHVKTFSLTQTSGGQAQNFVPSVFGAYNWLGIGSPKVAGETNVMLPTYIYYVLFKALMYGPTIDVSNSQDVLNPIAGTKIAQYVTVDAFFGIGFIMLPWWGITLGLVIYFGFSFIRIFVWAIYRLFVLVALFFVVILAAYYAVADGGKLWTKLMKSVLRWFFYNMIYIAIINIMCAVVFFVFFIGQVIVNGFESWYSANWSSISQVSSSDGGIPNAFGQASTGIDTVGGTIGDSGSSIINSANLGVMTGFASFLLSICLGVFSVIAQGAFNVSTVISSLVLMGVLIGAFVAAKQAEKQITQRYFAKDDIFKFGQNSAREFGKSMIYAGAGTFGLIGVGNLATGLMNRLPGTNKLRRSLNAKGARRQKAARDLKSAKNSSNQTKKYGAMTKMSNGKYGMADGQSTYLYNKNGQFVGTISKNGDNYKAFLNDNYKSVNGLTAYTKDGTPVLMSDFMRDNANNLMTENFKKFNGFRTNRELAESLSGAKSSFADGILGQQKIGNTVAFNKTFGFDDAKNNAEFVKALKEQPINNINDYVKSYNDVINSNEQFKNFKQMSFDDVKKTFSREFSGSGYNYQTAAEELKSFGLDVGYEGGLKKYNPFYGDVFTHRGEVLSNKNGDNATLDNLSNFVAQKQYEERLKRVYDANIAETRAKMYQAQTQMGWRQAVSGLGGAVLYGALSGAGSQSADGKMQSKTGGFGPTRIAEWIGASKLFNMDNTAKSNYERYKNQLYGEEAGKEN